MEITKTKKPGVKPEVSKLKFGHHFSDHMLEIDWNSKTGWGKPQICPVHNFSMHPGSKCLHYAVEVGNTHKKYFFIILTSFFMFLYLPNIRFLYLQNTYKEPTYKSMTC